MINLNSIISSFSNEEKQQFVTFLDRKNKRHDTKNIQLFKLLDNPTAYNSKEICHKLYKNNNTSAYHALRKRLTDALIDFIANTNLEDENSIDIHIIKYLIAARSFFLRHQYKTAYNILDKAEKLAIDHQFYPILNEIYHTKIQYAYTLSIDIDQLIEKLKENQKHYHIENQLNIVYAKIRQTINAIIYNGEIINFSSILENTLKTHNISINESMSFKALYQIMQIVSISAFATKNYINIEPFLFRSFNALKRLKLNPKQHYYYIEVLYIIANTLFRNKKFDESLNYLNQMKHEISSNKKKYHKPFILKYSLLLGLNYNYTNQQDKAIETFLPFIKTKHQDLDSLLKIHLSLTMFYFQKNDFKKVQMLISNFYHTDHWYINKAGKEWVIQKHLIEILLYIELGHIDLVDSRLLSFKRHYIKYLKDIRQERAIVYLNFIETYYKNPEYIRSEAFYNTVEASFVWVEAKEEDIFAISFYAWLKSKMEKKPLYETTLKLVNLSTNIG